MRHFRPEAEKRIAELCAREVVCTLVAGVSRVEPTRLSPSLKTLSDGLRRSPPLEHKLHRKKGTPHKPNLNPVSCARKEKLQGGMLVASDATACVGGLPHAGRFLRHDLPSWNAQACSSLHLNYIDPMSSVCACGELGNNTASLAPPSKFTHLSYG